MMTAFLAFPFVIKHFLQLIALFHEPKKEMKGLGTGKICCQPLENIAIFWCKADRKRGVGRWVMVCATFAKNFVIGRPSRFRGAAYRRR